MSCVFGEKSLITAAVVSAEMQYLCGVVWFGLVGSGVWSGVLGVGCLECCLSANLSSQVKSNQVKSSQAKSSQIISSQIKSN